MAISPDASFDPVAGSIDPANLFPGTRWSSIQRRVLALMALAIVLDGFDNQLLGIIIPALMREWGVAREAFVPVVASSLLALSAGSAVAGRLADRIGRRPVMIGSVLLFGVATFASALADGILPFSLYRVVAALGLGGAVPIATALLAEFAPSRRRGLAVTTAIVCFPVGAFIAGLIAARILPTFGWRTMVMIGGAMPVAGATVIAWLLPESPSYLASSPGRARRLHAFLDRHLPELDRSRGLVEAPAMPTGDRSAIFARDMRGDTLVLWSAFFFCSLALYAMFNWGPTMLTGAGYGISAASGGLAAFNLGGIVGALSGAVAVDRYRSTRPIMVIAAGGAISSTVAAALFASGGATVPIVIAALAVQGAFLTALQITLLALATAVYPALIRASGVGAALAVGRLGAVLSALAGAMALRWGAGAFLLVLGASALLSGIMLSRLGPQRA